MRILNLVAVAAALLPSLILAPSAAKAHDGALRPVEIPPAPPGDGAAAEALLRVLEAEATKDPETANVVAEPIQHAKRALQRAHGARMAGDGPHARMLDGVALGWAEAARDLERAARAERVATATSKKALEVQTKAERTRALLEETQARRGRAAAELDRADAEAKEKAQSAADAETHRIDAAKKKAAKTDPKNSRKGGK